MLNVLSRITGAAARIKKKQRAAKKAATATGTFAGFGQDDSSSASPSPPREYVRQTTKDDYGFGHANFESVMKDRRQRKPKLFGAPITSQTPSETGPKVPKILLGIIRYLVNHDFSKAKGIFRLAGTNYRTVAIERDIEDGMYDDGDFQGLDAKWTTEGGRVSPYTGEIEMEPPVYEMAELLKKYFRSLPDPILTPSAIPRAKQVAARADQVGCDETREAIASIIESLPQTHQHLIRLLLDVLVLTVADSDQNLMGPANLGRVWGPNIAPVTLMEYLPENVAGGVGKGRKKAKDDAALRLARMQAAAAGLRSTEWSNKFLELAIVCRIH